MAVAGDLDVTSAPELRDRLNHAVERGVRQLVVGRRALWLTSLAAAARREAGRR